MKFTQQLFAIRFQRISIYMFDNTKCTHTICINIYMFVCVYIFFYYYYWCRLRQRVVGFLLSLPETGLFPWQQPFNWIKWKWKRNFHWKSLSTDREQRDFQLKWLLTCFVMFLSTVKKHLNLEWSMYTVYHDIEIVTWDNTNEWVCCYSTADWILKYYVIRFSVSVSVSDSIYDYVNFSIWS